MTTAPLSRESQDDFLESGTKVGDYLIQERIGTGGMGQVYRAEQPLIGKSVAIKVLRRELSFDPISGERFLREARAANSIRHQGIVDVFGFSQLADGRRYMVMELLQGESLAQRLERDGPQHLLWTLSVVRQIAEVLVAVHAAGVIHRDIKPANVFVLGDNETVKVLDFGVAKVESQSAGFTSTGLVLGSLGYTSPEQARGKQLDGRSDIYALGVLFFELLFGRRFIESDNFADAMFEQRQAANSRARRLWPTLDRDTLELLETMVSLSPDERPPLRSIIERLRNLERRTSSDTRYRPEFAQAPRRSRAKRGAWLVASGLMVAAVGAIGAATAWTQTRSDPSETVGLTTDTDDRAGAETAGKAGVENAAHVAATQPEADKAMSNAMKVGGSAKVRAPPSSVGGGPGRSRRREPAAAPASVVKPGRPSAPSSLLSVSAKPWARVYVDGVLVASEKPIRAKPLKSGTHTLRFVHPPSGFSTERSIRVRRGEAVSVFVDVPAQSVTVDHR
ncbi:MAG: serine/threonine-protein kinase [Myxococcota bacterium]